MDAILNDLLENYYYNANEPTSFSRAQVLESRLRQENYILAKEALEQWFQRQLTALVYKPLKRKVQKNPIVSKYIDHIWNIDLLELAKPEDNDGVRFFLIAIDNLSKFVWLRKLANKQQGTVTAALRNIIDSSGRKPHILGCDFGKEFNNNTFKTYLQEQGISLYMLYAPDKAVLAERYIATLKSKVYKYLFFRESSRFIDIIFQLVQNYNHSVHSATKFRPIDVNEGNQRLVFFNLYKRKYRSQEDQRFNVGDRLLIPTYINKDPTKMEARFRRTKYNPEIYTVDKVLYSSPRYKYIVRDEQGQLIRNSFYSDHLVKTLL